MQHLTLTLDDLDAAAIHQAIAVRQSMRCDGPIMPDSDSDTAGAVLAEVCRGWLERIGKWPGRKGK